jgi:hypothetical protein
MRVEVTQEHIDKGKRADSACCMVALALVAIPGITDASVGNDIMRFYSGGIYMYFECNDVVKKNIVMFDCGNPVEPFEFECKPTYCNDYDDNDEEPDNE